MKKFFGVAAVLALLTGGAATSALAQCGTGVMIDYDADAMAYEPNYNPATYTSTATNVLSMIGTVSLFCAPFAALNPNDPNKEYTFYVTGLVSAGTGHFGPFGGTTFHETDYAGGTFEIHEGSPRNAYTAVGGFPPLPDATIPANY